MSRHILKTDPDQFEASAYEVKTFEIRYNDRDYQVGDVLILRRTKLSWKQMKDGGPLDYTGEELCRLVTHILKGPIFGLEPGWVIMSVVRI